MNLFPRNFLLQEAIGHYRNTCSQSTIETLKRYKSNTRFFISYSIFHPNLRLLREDVNFGLKVPERLLTR